MRKILHISLYLGVLGLLIACTSTTPNRDATFGDATRQAKEKLVISPDYGSTSDASPLAIELEAGVKAYQNNTLVNPSGKAANPALVESITTSN